MLSTPVLLACCGVTPSLPADAGAPLFREVGAEALGGVRTVCGSDDKDYIIEVNGGGVALGDFDGDGDLDLVLVDGSTLERVAAGEPGFPPRLFRNDGTGHFTEARDVGLTGGQWGMGVATGDLDGDGWLDLVVTEWGPDRVFLNRAGERFEEVTEQAGLKGKAWSTSAALCDYDGDGALDLVVTGYLRFTTDDIASRTSGDCRWKGHAVMCGPEGLIPIHDRLYRGLGDGRFEEVSRAAGFRPSEAGFGLGVLAVDYDADGDTDLYVSNDSTPNHLWENQGDGTFVEVGFRRGVGLDETGKEQAGMGLAAGDLNGDGKPDLFVTNFSGESNALYVSGSRSFRERSDRMGLGGPSKTDLGWGTDCEDFDLDGDLDLIVFNGHVYPQADQPGTDSAYAQADRLYQNQGKRFDPLPLSDGSVSVSRACATGDIDRDGDLDVVALEMNGPVRVLRNTTRDAASTGGPHWLGVRLRGRGPNTQGLGARVRAVWAGGERTVEVETAGGYQAAVPAEAYFGLGAADTIERLEVHWPDGTTQSVADVAVDRMLTVEQPASEGAESDVLGGAGERDEEDA